MGRGRNWSVSDEADLRHLRGLGYNNLQIAGMIGRSHDAVCKKAIEVGISHHHPGKGIPSHHPKARISDIVAAKGAYSARVLAVKHGLTRNAVIGIWRRHA